MVNATRVNIRQLLPGKRKRCNANATSAGKKNKKLKCANNEAGKKTDDFMLVNHISVDETDSMSAVLRSAFMRTAMLNRRHSWSDDFCLSEYA